MKEEKMKEKIKPFRNWKKRSRREATHYARTSSLGDELFRSLL